MVIVPTIFWTDHRDEKGFIVHNSATVMVALYLRDPCQNEKSKLEVFVFETFDDDGRCASNWNGFSLI